MFKTIANLHRSLHFQGLFLAIIFFAVGFFTLNDYGQTIDEYQSYRASLLNLKILPRVFQPEARNSFSFHEIYGYMFVFDAVRGAIATTMENSFSSFSFEKGFHLANLFFSSLSVYLLFMAAFFVSGNKRLSILIAACLILSPQFIAHSQNNPKDLPRLFSFMLAIFIMVRGLRKHHLMYFLMGGMGIGLALATSSLSFISFPVILLWSLIFKKDRPKKYWLSLAVVILIGGLFFILFWPWVWDAPIQKIMSSFHHIRTFSFETMEIYLDKTYRTENLPWHYFIVNLMATTPSIFIISSVLALISLNPYFLLSKTQKALVGLGGIWILISILFEANSPARYNSTRHFLMIIPGLCILAGTGIDLIYRWTAIGLEKLLPAFKAQRIAAIIIIFPFLILLMKMVKIHPYQGAFLNFPTNLIIKKPSENYFSVEYFGHAYKEGAGWLNLNAEKNARIYVPIFTHCANRNLINKATTGSLNEFKGKETPGYLMYITRVTRYNELIRFAERNLTPVFVIKRQNGNLLKIYKNF